jgi:hypothetical protein
MKRGRDESRRPGGLPSAFALAPCEFREQFAVEMLLDYKAGLREICGSALHWDTLVSLGRQWLLRFAETSEAETVLPRCSAAIMLRSRMEV